MADGAVQAPVFNPNQPYDVVNFAGQANTAAPTQANAAVPTQANAAPAFNPNQPYDVVTSSKEQPTSDQGLGTFGKIFAGSGTAAGASPSESQQEEAGGVSDVLSGNVGQGIRSIIHAETPHVVQGSPIEKLIQQFKPDFRGSLTPEQAQDLHDKDYAGIEKPVVDVAQTIDKNQHPVLKALTEAAQSMTSPGNVAVMISTGGLGMVESPKALATANKLISAGFSASAVGQAYKNLKSFKEAYDRGDANDALYQLTHAVTSGTMAYLAGSHAAGAPVAGAEPSTAAGKAIQEHVVEPITEGVGRGAQAAGEAVKGAAGNVVSGVKKGLGIGDDFYNTVKKISPPSKGYAMEYNQTLKTAEPQLREVFRQNPDVTTPQEMHDAIDEHIKQTEARLGAKAAQFEGKPESQMTGIEAQVRADLNKAFAENKGQYKPAEQEKAVQAVIGHLLQEEPGQLEGTKTLREPSLAEAEGARQRFSDDSKPIYGAGAPSVPAAEMFAKDVAAKSLRQAIDDKFDQLGVKDVKEWRRQEAALIDVRDQIADAQKKADEMGTYNVLESLTKQFGWKTVLGFAAGAAGGPETGLTGALAASGLGAVADYIKDLKLNPNRKVAKASELANQPGPTGAVLPKDIPPGQRGPGAVNPTKATAAPAPGSELNLESRSYEVPTESAMDVPVDRRNPGEFSRDTHIAEWGHVTNGALEGFKTKGIKSHLHPELKDTSAQASAGFKTDINFKDPDDVQRNFGKILSTVLGHAAAQELHSDIPFEMNRSIGGDIARVKQIGELIGLSDDEMDGAIRYGLDRAKRNLTQPGISDKLLENVDKRETGLDQTMHASPERTEAYADEIRRIQDENRSKQGDVRGNVKPDAGRTREASEAMDARTEGKASEGNPGRNLESRAEVSPQKMVEDQGLVYKGKIEGPTPETSVHQFESKEAPSVTMALRQDKMTPEAIKAKAAAKLVEGAIIPKVDLRATKAAEDWRDMVPGAEKAFKKPNVVAAPTKGESWFHGRRGDIKFEEGRPAFFTRDKEGANWYANERGPKEGKSTIGEFNLDIKKPARLRDVIQAIKETGAIDKDVQAHSVYGGEEENYQDYLYVPKVRENLSKKGFDGFVGHDILENTDLEIAVPFSAKQINTVGPDITENAKQVAESVRKGEGFAADLRTGKPTDTGFLVEVMPENRRILDHDVTPKDIQKFYNDNRQLFKDNPELRVGGYKNELNISAHTEDQAAATTLAKKLDQRSVWDVQKGEEIPTGGQGRVTHFSYPFENRMKDLRHGG